MQNDVQTHIKHFQHEIKYIVTVHWNESLIGTLKCGRKKSEEHFIIQSFRCVVSWYNSQV